MAELEKLVEEVSKLTLLEASELVKMLEEKLGVSAAAPMAMAAMPMAAAAEPAEEKTEFGVVLKDFGAKKIDVIKTVRKLTGLGLREAKNLVESAPTTVMEQVAKEAAEDARAQLEEAGATVELQ